MFSCLQNNGKVGKADICPVKKIALFASGAGTNAARIIEKFRDHAAIKVALVVCNKQRAGVVGVAEKNNIPVLFIEQERFSSDAYLEALKKAGIDFIVLAGFLWKIPSSLIAAFPNAIINIHPALLPKYGGKGMYGLRVHQAVIDNHETESGITIHYVDEVYDNGDIIFQEKCEVLPTDTATSLAERVALLEHNYYSEIIERML